ncbi:MAG: response regulator [Proteobacteria bacterium]|nr:response regulator [Pseudomonadota bacterium]
MAGAEEPDKILKQYLSENSIVILDAISSGRTNVASCLSRLGAARHKMSLVGSIGDAREELKRNKSKIIFADFMIGKDSSLDLIQFQRKVFEQDKVKDALFVLVTANASQSAVAQAAEEDVDTFIVKPFSFDTMKSALESAVMLKLRPNPYLQLIDQGKELMFAGDYGGAIDKFKAAKDQSPTPTLACFYLGQAETMKQALDAAEGNYLDGLNYNKIHYKCLIGLFDLFHGEKRYVDAYEIMKRLAQYFPANPKRLGTVLRLSVLTNNFHDVDSYYRIYVEMDERNDELIRQMCSALAVTGRYYLRQRAYPRAIEIFESAAISSAGRTPFLLYIIEALAEYGLTKEADPFLSRLQKIAPGSQEVLAAQFLTLDQAIDVKDVVNRGRGILRDGVENPSVYEKLIIASIKAGYKDKALELADFARKRWPERARYFLRGFTPAELKAIGL